MKKIFIMMMLLLGAISMSAQQTTVEGSKFLDNTTVGITVSDINPMVGSWEPNLRVGVQLGKWFTPSVGIEVEDIATFQKATGNGILQSNYIGATGLVNLSNAIWKYNGTPRTFEWGLYSGAGWAHYGYYDAQDLNFFVVRHGAFLNYNLGEKKAWTITWRPGVEYILAGEGLTMKYDVNRGLLHALNFGVTYKFGYKNSLGKKTHNFTRAYTSAEYDAIVQKLYAAESKHDTIVQLQRIYVEQRVEVPVVQKQVLKPHFKCGSADIDATTESALDEVVADMTNTGYDYVITGYASVEGGDETNNALSLNRANVVKDYLVKCGIDESRLTTVGAGPTDAFGTDYEANRLVIISKK